MQSIRNISRKFSRFNFAHTPNEQPEQERYKYIVNIINRYLRGEEAVQCRVLDGRPLLASAENAA